MHKSSVVDATGWGNSCSDIHDVGWGGDFSHSSTGGLTSSFASAESLWKLGVSFLFWLENPSTEFHNTQNNFTLDLSSTKRSPRSRRFFLAPRCIHRRWESGEGELENGGECYIEIRVSSHKPMKSEDLILSEKVLFFFGTGRQKSAQGQTDDWRYHRPTHLGWLEGQGPAPYWAVGRCWRQWQL